MLFIIPLNVSSISMQYIHLGRPFFQREDLPFFVYVLGKGKNEKNSAGFLLCNCHGSALTNLPLQLYGLETLAGKTDTIEMNRDTESKRGGGTLVNAEFIFIYFLYSLYTPVLKEARRQDF